MKILLWIILYLVIGMILCALISKNFRSARGYSIRDFNDLDSNEQGMMVASAFLWPLVIVIAAVYFAMDGVLKITNRKDGS